MRFPFDQAAGCVCMCVCLITPSASVEAHPYPPGVVGENFVLLLHNTGVCSLVDCIGHYTDVVVFQGDVARVGVLQKLPILIPTAGRNTNDAQLNQLTSTRLKGHLDGLN